MAPGSREHQLWVRCTATFAALHGYCRQAIATVRVTLEHNSQPMARDRAHTICARRRTFSPWAWCRQHDHPERRNGSYRGVRLLICILLVKVQSARSNAEEKTYENRIVACGIVLARIDSREKERNMIIPSLLTWVIGTAVLVLLSVVLRYVANEADEVARSQGRASVAAEPKGAGTFRKAA
jgi:hypothetical protein